ncbi:MAG: carboxypeptidase-like regulatory domain-containing protein [Candidatus Saccharimonadales bacterium]
MPEDNQKPTSAEPSETLSLPIEKPVEEPKTTTPEPAALPNPKPATSSGSKLNRFKRWYVAHKKLSIPLTVLTVVLVLMAIPLTRYKTLGLAIKKDVTVSIIDSETDSGVSAAEVLLAGRKAETDGQGVARFQQVPVGQYVVQITKKYYKSGSAKMTVGLTGGATTTQVKVDATGRPVEVKVTNKISGQTLANVEVVAGDIKAKSDKDGLATLIVSAGTVKLEAELSLEGFNTSKATFAVTKDNKPNSAAITPAGKIYFLSKLSGKIDVVKSNLDGSERKTVLAGTGKEESSGTVLLASRDWKYLALLSRREGNQANLYLIETATDKLTTLDEGNARFDLVGWSDNYFVYKVTRLTYSDWQAKKYVIKNYNAQTKQLAILDQSQAAGNSGASYAYESLDDIYALGDTVVYTKVWFDYGFEGNDFLKGKVSGLFSIRNNGTNKKSIKTFTADKLYYIYVTPSKASELYVEFDQPDDTVYVRYSGGSVQEVKADDIPEEYDTYLLSPSGNESFWTEQRDGKERLFVGDKDGLNGQEAGALNNHTAYGWHSDNYLLVSKNESELYILPKSGISDTIKPLKITDYHKPAQDFRGYGGGYGGL